MLSSSQPLWRPDSSSLASGEPGAVHVFRSVLELNQAIRDYLDAHNADPKPFRWTASANTIIGKHQRGKHLPESLH